MITEEENRLICEVEGSAPMGQLMRRHWIPALMSEEVEIDGKPVRVRLFGEDLVAFRDSNGDVGLIDEFCPHRGPSLYFGRNENCGLRCLYHGWKFDKDGKITEMPSEPPESQMKERIKIKAYPTKEAGGFVDFFEEDKSLPLKRNIIASNSIIHEKLRDLIEKKDIE